MFKCKKCGAFRNVPHFLLNTLNLRIFAYQIIIKFQMELYNIFKKLLKWNDTEYTISISDIRQHCEHFGYHPSYFIDDVKQTLNEMMFADEIECFLIGERDIVISK